MILISIGLLFISLVLIFTIPLNIKRFINKKSIKKWAFFHPFWYHVDHIAMMEEVVKKCCGA